MAVLTTRTVRIADLVADVAIAAPANGQALLYDSASSRWKNAALPAFPDLTAYVLQTGRAGGQQVVGGTDATQGLSLQGTSDTVATTNITSVCNTRIWQTGANKAALVETMRLDSSGRLGIGVSSPQYALHLQRTGATSANFVSDQVSDTNGNGLFLQRAKGTLASPTAVADGLSATIAFRYYDGSLYSNSGQITCVVRGTPGAPGSSAIPVDLVFNTSNNVAWTAEKMRLTSDSRLGLFLGTGVVPSAGLHVKNHANNAAIATARLDSAASQTANLLELRADPGGAKNDLLHAYYGAGTGSYLRINYQSVLVLANQGGLVVGDAANGEYWFRYNSTTNVVSMQGRDSTGTLRTLTLGTMT